MFTGLVEEIGVISRRSGPDLAIMAKTILSDLKTGDSVAVDGVCLTVTAVHAGGFTADAMPETVRRTTLGERRPGDGQDAPGDDLGRSRDHLARSRDLG